MDIDPAAVVRRRPVVVTLAGTDYRIPALSATEWLMHILERSWADVVPGLLEQADHLDDLYDLLNDGTVTTAECVAAAKDALSSAAGVDWWVAARLVHAAAADPGAFGELRLAGTDLDTAPLGAVIAALYRIYTRDRERKDVDKFEAELTRTPPGMSAAERYDEQAAGQAFEDFFAARGGR